MYLGKSPADVLIGPTVSSVDISDGGVATVDIAADAITGAKIADNAVDSEHYTDGSVDNVHVATGLDAVKIADGSVTNAELQYINSLSSNAQTQISAKSPIASPTFTGTVVLPNVPAIVTTQLDLKSPLASPTFTGTPAAPTASAATNTTQLATTAFVRTEVTNLVDSAPSALDTLNELAAALGDDANFSTTVTNSIATKLPLAGGTITGNVDMASDNIRFRLGVSQDLQIWHSGSDSLIADSGTGNMLIGGSGEVALMDNSFSEYMVRATHNSWVKLYHDNAEKLATTSTGIEVAGNIVVSGTVDSIDVAARDAILSSTTTTAGAALPKAGGTMTGGLIGTTGTFSGMVSVDDLLTLGSQSNGGNSFQVNRARFMSHENGTADLSLNAYYNGSAWINDSDSNDSHLLRLYDDEGMTYYRASPAGTPSFVSMFAVDTSGNATFAGSVTVKSSGAVSATPSTNHGKIEYASNRFYFHADASSESLATFRRGSSDVIEFGNAGTATFAGDVTIDGSAQASGETTQLQIKDGDSNPYLIKGTQVSAKAVLAFNVGGGDKMVVNSDGNVGIGTDAPTAVLDIATTADFSQDLKIRNDTVTMRMYASSANVFNFMQTTNNDMVFFTNDTERFRIAAAGAATFSGNIHGTGSSILLKGSSNDNAFIGLYDDKSISLYTDNVERLRIDTTHAAFGTNINTVILGDSTTHTYFYMDSANSSGGFIRFRDATNDTRCAIQADLQGDNNAYGDLSFMTGGNVLALNLSRDQNAEFSGDVTLSNSNAIRWSSDDVRIEGTTSGDNIAFYAGGAEQLKISQADGFIVEGEAKFNGHVNVGYNDSCSSTPRLVFGSETGAHTAAKCMFLSSCWFVMQGHRNEGILFQGVNAGGTAQEFLRLTGDNHGTDPTTAKFSVPVLPNADNTYSLGSSGNRWANLYVADMQMSNEGTGGNDVDGTEGSWTIQEGEDDLFLLNRKNGKKYKFKLEVV